MKKLKLGATLLILFIAVYVTPSWAQIEHPVHWSYAIKKLSSGTYAVFLRATIDTGWHIYAQKQSKDAIAIPTKLTFEKKQGMTLLGQPLEQGKKETYRLKEVGITNYEYAGKVDFVQKVRLPPGQKEVRGTVVFQACTHSRCLPEDTFSFVIPVTE